MALGSCYKCLKYLMFVFNFIFWAIGCALLAVGIWAKVDQGRLPSFISEDVASSLNVYAWVIIVVGAVVLVIGFFGCCGAIRESQCMLATFFVFLLLIFIGLLAIGIIAYVTSDGEDMEKKLGEKLEEHVKKYTNTTESQKLLDDLQKEFHCCGAFKGDFAKTWPQNVTKACGDDYKEQEGCAKAITKVLEGFIIIIVAVVLAIAVIMLLGMIFSMLLCCAIREVAW